MAWHKKRCVWFISQYSHGYYRFCQYESTRKFSKEPKEVIMWRSNNYFEFKSSLIKLVLGHTYSFDVVKYKYSTLIYTGNSLIKLKQTWAKNSLKIISMFLKRILGLNVIFSILMDQTSRKLNHCVMCVHSEVTVL